MSSWRIIVKNLHAIGGMGVRARFDGDFATSEASNSAIQRAKELRLVRKIGGGCGSKWELTALGREFAEGRAEIRREPSLVAHRPREFVGINWLASLPRDIRIIAGDA